MGLIIAIDPGCTESGYVVVRHDGNEITQVVDKGKVENEKIFFVLNQYLGFDLAIEMVACYGMPVGAEVFDTCVWVGRFLQVAGICARKIKLIYRKEEKLNLCGTPAAKDANIVQALIDRYAYGQPNKGKGTKKQPGFFYGFAKDVWQAMAVAVTYFDLYGKNENG